MQNAIAYDRPDDLKFAKWTAIAYGDHMFVAVSSSRFSSNVMSSKDGVTWSIISVNSENLLAIGFGGGVFAAIPQTGTTAAVGVISCQYANGLSCPDGYYTNDKGDGCASCTPGYYQVNSCYSVLINQVTLFISHYLTR